MGQDPQRTGADHVCEYSIAGIETVSFSDRPALKCGRASHYITASLQGGCLNIVFYGYEKESPGEVCRLVCWPQEDVDSLEAENPAIP